MNRRLTLILLSAFAIAAACSFLVLRVVGARLSANQGSTTPIVVAARDIQLGSVLRDTDLKTVNMSGPLPKGAILKRENAIGRGVISNLYEGEPVSDSRLAAVGSGGGLAATIRPGMRACAVKVDEVVGVAGFVTPGMRVDVLVSGNPPGPGNTAEGTKVKTLLQNIEVLSAGTDIQKDAEGKPQQVQVVNLLVTPGQAELLSLASSQTRIQLVLRNPLDTEVGHTQGTAMASLFSDGTPVPKTPVVRTKAAPKPSRFYLVEVFNGAKRSQEKFASDEDK